MAFAYKVLGQVEPAATTATDLYTVPAATEAVLSTLVVCNKGAACTVRVAVRVAGATLTDKQYIIYDALVPGSDSLNLTLGISLAATDVVTVYASTADVSFSAFGGEQ